MRKGVLRDNLRTGTGWSRATALYRVTTEFAKITRLKPAPLHIPVSTAHPSPLFDFGGWARTDGAEYGETAEPCQSIVVFGRPADVQTADTATAGA